MYVMLGWSVSWWSVWVSWHGECMDGKRQDKSCVDKMIGWVSDVWIDFELFTDHNK